jgi:hypothetical protein
MIVNVLYLAGVRNFCLLQKSRPTVGPTVSYPMGTEDPVRLDNRSVPEADYLPPTSVEVKNEWSYTSTVPNVPSWPVPLTLIYFENQMRLTR